MNPFRNILRLSIGDFIAKALNFLAFVYLARVLGVESYGVLEFSLSILTYFLLFADGGLELWAIQMAARGEDMRELAARVVPLRLILACGSFGLLLALLPLLPSPAGFRPVMILFGVTLFTQAVNLRWVFMGQQQMAHVATGLVLAQLVFALAAFGIVHNSQALIFIPVMRLISDVTMVLYFGWLFARTHGGFQFRFSLGGARKALRPALTLGASHGLAFMSYNFDTILLGLMAGTAAVGWYSAAYKPVTVMLAMPTTYFLGLFPALSRASTQSQETFNDIATRSFRLAAVVAVPLGISSIFLAEPIIRFLFGPAYMNAVPALMILGWSAMLVILRGTFRQSLNAAGRARLDLRCAGAAVTLNVCLNLLLIPRYGIIGAACATLVSEVLWFSMAYYYFNRHLVALPLASLLLQPVTGAIVLGLSFFLTQHLFWGVRVIIGALVYFGTLWLLGQREVRAVLKAVKSEPPGAQREPTTL